MSESTIDMDRAMQGIDCEVITWTKCIEQMPTHGARIILNAYGEYMKFVWDNATAGKLTLERAEWTLYTPEAWAKINK